jgi:hypothetical protein
MPKPKEDKVVYSTIEAMWTVYRVEMKMTGRFAASLPKTREEIEQMLEHRMPTVPPPDFVPIDDLANQVAEKVGASEGEEEEAKFGWATFPRNDDGLYYEGRCIRGHLKDCATQVSGLFEPKMSAFKAKVANKVYVMTDVIPLTSSLGFFKEPTGTEQRFVQVMTRQGPRSTIKYVDYLEKPTLSFELKTLNDGVITEGMLRVIFDYGSIHGLGQERSQGWGRYTYTLTGK